MHSFQSYLTLAMKLVLNFIDMFCYLFYTIHVMSFFDVQDNLRLQEMKLNAELEVLSKDKAEG